jgi:hypothetical protein
VGGCPSGVYTPLVLADAPDRGRMSPQDDLVGPPRLLARAEVMRCRRCHQPLAPASMLAKVQQALGALAPDKRWDLQQWCAGCRLANSLCAVRGDREGQA